MLLSWISFLMCAFGVRLGLLLRNDCLIMRAWLFTFDILKPIKCYDVLWACFPSLRDTVWPHFWLDTNSLIPPWYDNEVNSITTLADHFVALFAALGFHDNSCDLDKHMARLVYWFFEIGRRMSQVQPLNIALRAPKEYLHLLLRITFQVPSMQSKSDFITLLK